MIPTWINRMYGSTPVPPDPDQPILDLFANGEVGFWADIDDYSTLFQDADATIPVTAPGQPDGNAALVRLAE